MQYSRPSAAILALLLILGVGCSSNDGGKKITGVDSTQLNDFVTQLPDWQQPASYLNSGVATSETITDLTADIPDYRCDVQQHSWAKSDNEIFAPEQDFATLWPGAVFQGRFYKSGTLAKVDVPRSPITIFSNLPGSKSITVDDPTSVTMNDAVNAVRGSVDPESYQSEWEFRIDEVYSNLQGTMEVGANAGYSSVASGALSISESRSIAHHIYFGRAMQRMYTIRFADDDLATPAEFFGPGTTARELKDAGLDENNVPVYVRSITYGQMILFKAEITTKESTKGFKADFKAAWDGFTGGGSGGTTGSDLLKQATYKALGYGGQPGSSASAQSAIEDQQFGKFFDGATVQNAVPLFFEVVTLKDGEPANLGESVTYETWENAKAATGYTLDVDFRRIKANRKTDRNISYAMEVDAGAILTPRGYYASGLIDFPVANHWYPIDKQRDAKVGTNPLNKFQIVFGKAVSLSGVGPRWEYPYTNVPRDTWTQLLPYPTVQITDGILPSAPKSTISADIRYRLTPTYD